MIDPRMPPANVIAVKSVTSLLSPLSSREEDMVAPTPDRTRPAVFVTFATTGGMSIKEQAGYETSEANPAMEANKPPKIPATIK
jgi:hypothetical protein